MDTVFDSSLIHSFVCGRTTLLALWSALGANTPERRAQVWQVVQYMRYLLNQGVRV
jgi:hypothetical protein